MPSYMALYPGLRRKQPPHKVSANALAFSKRPALPFSCFRWTASTDVASHYPTQQNQRMMQAILLPAKHSGQFKQCLCFRTAETAREDCSSRAVIQSNKRITRSHWLWRMHGQDLHILLHVLHRRYYLVRYDPEHRLSRGVPSTLVPRA
jgi:hypothetical protein